MHLSISHIHIARLKKLFLKPNLVVLLGFVGLKPVFKGQFFGFLEVLSY